MNVVELMIWAAARELLSREGAGWAAWRPHLKAAVTVDTGVHVSPTMLPEFFKKYFLFKITPDGQVRTVAP